MQINPYLVFPGTCREAFTFYADALGGEIVAMSTHGEIPSGEDRHGPEMDDMVMHAQLVVGGQVLMGSDAPPQMYQKPQGTMVTLTLESPEEADRIYALLAEGAQIYMEMQETFWAQRFAMLADRFGTPWMISCNKPFG